MSGAEPQRPPIPQAPLVDNRGYVTREWWRWFHNVGLVEVGNTTNVVSTIISQAGDTNFSGGLNERVGLDDSSRRTLQLQTPGDRVFPDQIVLQARQLDLPQDAVGPEQAASLAIALRPIDFASIDQASLAAVQICTPADQLPLDQLALMAMMLAAPPASSTSSSSSTSTPTADWDDPFLGAWSAGGWGTGAWGGLYYGIIPPSTAGQFWMARGDGVTPEWSRSGDDGSRLTYNGNRYQTVGAAPANFSTASLTEVMAGDAVAFTPSTSGLVEVMIGGTIENNTINDGAFVRIRYGTGAAPVSGVAFTGTASSGQNFPAFGIAAQRWSYFVVAIIQLVVGTVYWFDKGAMANIGGTMTLSGSGWLIKELP